MSASIKDIQDNLEEVKSTSNKKSFFRNSLSTLTLLAVLAGGAFAAMYYIGAAAISAVVSTALKVGLDISFLNSMSVLAASATIAGAGAATLYTAIAAVSLVVNTVTSVISSCFSWTSNIFSSSNPTDVTSTAVNTEKAKEEVKEKTVASTAKAMNGLGDIPKQEAAPTIDSPIASPKEKPVFRVLTPVKDNLDKEQNDEEKNDEALSSSIGAAI